MVNHLSEKEIQYGFNHIHNFPKDIKKVVELSEYNGEIALTINCTQLDENYKPKDKKRIVSEWIDFLTHNPDTFSELRFGTRVSQELFNAVCQQKNLKKLHIKWGVYPDISKISNLTQLECLHLGSGVSIESIEPISKLGNLVALYVENYQKIDDYSLLSNLKKLESLSINGDFAAPRILNIKSLDFLKDMPQLRFLCLLTTRVKSKDYTPVLELKNLEHLTLNSTKEVKELYDDLVKLPKLKYGFLKDYPEAYKE